MLQIIRIWLEMHPRRAAYGVLGFALFASASAATSAQAFTPAYGEEPIPNPYCDVPTYTSSRFNGSARAFISYQKKPVIVVDRAQLNNARLTEFFLAHECCHHRLGHLDRRTQPIAAINGRAITSDNAKMELEADCCAAKLLQEEGNRAAIKAARLFVRRYGPRPTGFGYPTGIKRDIQLKSCSITKKTLPPQPNKADRRKRGEKPTPRQEKHHPSAAKN